MCCASDRRGRPSWPSNGVDEDEEDGVAEDEEDEEDGVAEDEDDDEVEVDGHTGGAEVDCFPGEGGGVEEDDEDEEAAAVAEDSTGSVLTTTEGA